MWTRDSFYAPGDQAGSAKHPRVAPSPSLRVRAYAFILKERAWVAVMK